MPSTNTIIAKQKLSSSAGSVTFSSIPGTYTDLKLLVSARSDWSTSHNDIIRIRFNGGGDTNNATRYIWGDGSSISTGAYTYSSGGYCPAATATNNTFGSSEIYIGGYAGTAHAKPISISAAGENFASAASVIEAGARWNSTSAITSITLVLSVGSFVAGSSFYLYGITKA